MTGEPLAPVLSNTAAAQRRQIGPEHVKMIRQFFAKLPGFIDFRTREAADSDRPSGVRTAARRNARCRQPAGNVLGRTANCQMRSGPSVVIESKVSTAGCNVPRLLALPRRLVRRPAIARSAVPAVAPRRACFLRPGHNARSLWWSVLCWSVLRRVRRGRLYLTEIRCLPRPRTTCTGAAAGVVPQGHPERYLIPDEHRMATRRSQSLD